MLLRLPTWLDTYLVANTKYRVSESSPAGHSSTHVLTPPNINITNTSSQNSPPCQYRHSDTKAAA